jgi:CDP-diacylglycerol--serine O-phosphatidyltransferase
MLAGNRPRVPSFRAVKLFDPVPVRTIPPNVITATAMGFGLASAFVSLTSEVLPAAAAAERLLFAAWLVLISVLLDKLDGSVARALKGSSQFGVEFDSFADATAFGIAPAALVHAAATTLTPEVWGGNGVKCLGIPAASLLGGVCLVYAVMTTVRLARFNVTTAAIGPKLFLGLPSTLSGALLCSGFIALWETGIGPSQPYIVAWLPAWLVLNAALMVSNLPLPKFHLADNKAVRLVQMGLAVAVYGAVLANFGITVVFLLLCGFLLFGFAWSGPRLYREVRQPPAPD